MQKLTNLLDFEHDGKKVLKKVRREGEENELRARQILSKQFLNNQYIVNQKIEYKNLKEQEDLIYFNNLLAAIFPATFFNQTYAEIATSGFLSYLDFFHYLMKVRDNFMNFIVYKRYYSKDKDIVPFFKGEENVFKARSRIPNTFWIGIFLTFIYTLIFFAVSFLSIQKKRRTKTEIVVNGGFNLSKLKSGKAYFVLCRDSSFRNQLFRQLSGNPGVVALDQVTADDIDPELPPHLVIPYLCHLRGIKDMETVNHFVERLEIEDYKFFKLRRKEGVSEEELKKIYCAVRLAEADEAETILINDCLAGVSKSFDRCFIKILQEFLHQNKRIIYLSDEMFLTVTMADFDELQGDNEFEIHRVNLEDISLR